MFIKSKSYFRNSCTKLTKSNFFCMCPGFRLAERIKVGRAKIKHPMLA